MNLFKWLRMRAQQQREAYQNRGYDYAAGVLLCSGAIGAEQLQQEVEAAKSFGSYNEFDRGIDKAIRHWNQLAKTDEPSQGDKALIVEACNFGQFSDDANWQLPWPVRKALVRIAATWSKP